MQFLSPGKFLKNAEIFAFTDIAVIRILKPFQTAVEFLSQAFIFLIFESE